MENYEKKAGKIGSLLREITGKIPEKAYFSAIIVAAGSSTRMNSDVPKQFLPLDGMDVVARTIAAYQNSDYIKEIIVVGREGDKPRYDEYKRIYSFTKLKKFVSGGATRQDSVICGLELVDDKCEFVAIADGARPLTTTEMIGSVCRAAYEFGAACAATKSNDTIKIANNSGFITETANRDVCWFAGTPQVFKLDLYRAAAYYAKEKGFSATDDCMLVENIKNPVKLVETGSDNIKITRKEDLLTAEMIIRKREAEMLRKFGGES